MADNLEDKIKDLLEYKQSRLDFHNEKVLTHIKILENNFNVLKTRIKNNQALYSGSLANCMGELIVSISQSHEIYYQLDELKHFLNENEDE